MATIDSTYIVSVNLAAQGSGVVIDSVGLSSVNVTGVGLVGGPPGPPGGDGPQGPPGDPGVVQNVIGGDNIDVDNSDLANPVVAVVDLVTADITDVTASAAELNTLDGITASTTELNYTDGVTSAIQTQIDNKQPLDADLTALAAAGNSTVLANTTASFLTADETKLDGIEALADVTDATNVNAAGATMNSDTTLAGNSYFLDEDTMSSDSATKVPSQQSVKAYVDTGLAANNDYDTTVKSEIPPADDTFQTAIEQLGERTESKYHDAMRHWRTAVANNQTTPVNVLVMGDSITEGWFVSSRWEEQWPAIMHQALADAFNGGKRGLGYVPASSGVIGSPGFSLATGGSNGTSTWGLARYYQNVPAGDTEEASLTTECDRISVLYGKHNYLVGSLNVRIDGSEVTSLGIYSGAYAAFDGESNFIYNSSALTDGTHTLAFRSDSGLYSSRVEGAYFYRGDYDKGIRVWNAGHFGTNAATFNSDNNYLDNYANFNWNLVVIAHANNHYGSGSTHYYDEITEMIDSINAAADTAGAERPSILLTMTWPTGGRTAAQWLPFRQRAKQIADEKGVGLLDLTPIMGATASDDDPYSLTYDGTHPVVKGMRTMGLSVANWLIDHAGTPRTYVTEEGKITEVADTTYTTNLRDRDRAILASHASGCAVTIPPNSSVAYPIGTKLAVFASGSGAIEITPGSGVTLIGETTIATTTGAYIQKTATNTWVIFAGGGGGTGDVVGPASSIDNELVRFNSTTGKLVQGASTITVDDSGNLTWDNTAARTVTIADVTTNGVAGRALTIRSGTTTGTSANGGAMAVIAGGGTAFGGAASMMSGGGLTSGDTQIDVGSGFSLGQIEIAGVRAAKVTVGHAATAGAQLHVKSASATVGLIVDNQAQTTDIIQLKDNGTDVFKIADGGQMTILTSLTGVLRADSGVVSTDSDVTDIVAAATTSAAGKVELAIASEVNTGTDATRAVTPDSLAGSNLGTKEVTVPVVVPGTALSTGDGKAYFRIPSSLNGMNLIACAAAVTTTSSSGTPTFQLARGRQSSATSAHSYVDMLSTRITIDATEYDSKDATAAAVIDTANDDVATGDLIRVDVDVTGTSTAGLFVTLQFQLP